MTLHPHLVRTWAAARWGRLLPLAARGPALVRAYSISVAEVELRLDPARRTAAQARIGRALSLSPDQALAVHRSSLVSEAREEAEAALAMRDPRSLARALAGSCAGRPATGPVIFATLHLGSPVLGWLALRRRHGVDAAMVGRPLDDANRMASAKQRWAVRKVAWAEQTGGRPFFATSGEDLARARAHLLAGGSLYTPFDVPGDVAARQEAVLVLGERVRLASGLTVLARLVGAPIQPVVTVSGADGLHTAFDEPIPPGAGDALLQRVMDSLAERVRCWPGEWWMWPYLPAA